MGVQPVFSTFNPVLGAGQLLRLPLLLPQLLRLETTGAAAIDRPRAAFDGCPPLNSATLNTAVLIALDGPGVRLTLYPLTFDALTLHPLRASTIHGRRAALDALLRTGAVLDPRRPALCLHALARLLGTGTLPLLLAANALASLRPIGSDPLLTALGGLRTSLNSTDSLLAALGGLRTSLRAIDALIAALGGLRTSLGAAGALLATIGSLCLSALLGFLSPLLGLRVAVTGSRLRGNGNRKGRNGGDQK